MRSGAISLWAPPGNRGAARYRPPHAAGTRHAPTWSSGRRRRAVDGIRGRSGDRGHRPRHPMPYATDAFVPTGRSDRCSRYTGRTRDDPARSHGPRAARVPRNPRLRQPRRPRAADVPMTAARISFDAWKSCVTPSGTTSVSIRSRWRCWKRRSCSGSATCDSWAWHSWSIPGRPTHASNMRSARGISPAWRSACSMNAGPFKA